VGLERRAPAVPRTRRHRARTRRAEGPNRPVGRRRSGRGAVKIVTMFLTWADYGRGMVSGGSESTPLGTLNLSAIRRSFSFILVPTVILFFVTALSESDQWTHALDDEIIVVVGLGLLVYLLITRKASSAADLTRISRIAAAVSVILALAGVLAVILEYKDPSDISDDPLTIVGGVVAAINALLLVTAAGPRVPEEMAAYSSEWSRIRTTFWFSTFFAVTFVFDLVPPYPAASLTSVPIWAEVALLLVFAIVGFVALSRSRTERDVGVLRRYNNTLFAVAVVVAVIALVNFDIATVGYGVVLIANRFL
jgi:hypothetical protein